MWHSNESALFDSILCAASDDRTKSSESAQRAQIYQYDAFHLNVAAAANAQVCNWGVCGLLKRATRNDNFHEHYARLLWSMWVVPRCSALYGLCLTSALSVLLYMHGNIIHSSKWNRCFHDSSSSYKREHQVHHRHYPSVAAPREWGGGWNEGITAKSAHMHEECIRNDHQSQRAQKATKRAPAA